MSRIFALLTLFWAAGAVPAHAQLPFVPEFDRPRWGFGLAMGPNVPAGAAGFNDTSKLGFGVGISAQRFLMPGWAIGLELNQSAFAGVPSPPILPVDGTFRIVGAKFLGVHFTTRFNLIMNSNWSPYIGAGIGLASGTSNVLTGTDIGNQLDVVDSQGASLSVRLGVERFNTNGLSFFSEIRYIQYRLDAQSAGPGIGAIALGGVHVTVGVRLWKEIKEKRR
ncbi:MAG: hypothetical protein COB53_04320 [Elusimicrobia bacterium]|nr:MAG: hypothetical protein COB53_04320 [Elusimicrobiota bacterium]